MLPFSSLRKASGENRMSLNQCQLILEKILKCFDKSSSLAIYVPRPLFSLPDVLCDPTDLIWWEKTPFEAMTGRTALSSDGLLAEVFLGCKANARRSVYSPRIISLSPLSLATDVTDATLGSSGLWLGTRTGAGGTATLSESFFGRSPSFSGQLGYFSIMYVLNYPHEAGWTPFQI